MMKLYLSLASTLLFSLTSIGQVSLKEYCPARDSQYMKTCASYAPVYTALSTQYNAQHGFTSGHPDFMMFSDGFVASKMKSNKPFRKRIINNCGKKVTAKMALEVLKVTGTVQKKDFPEGCDCGKQRRVEATGNFYKIASWKQIYYQDSSSTWNINAIKQSLNEKRPVIISIYQTDFFSNNEQEFFVFPESYQREPFDANHVVCIIGYDDARGGGAFLIKNNYMKWGVEKGFSYVKYEDMLKLIRGAYQMTL